MSLTREHMLRELELLPVWQQKTVVPVATAETVVPTADALVGAAEQLVIDQALVAQETQPLANEPARREIATPEDTVDLTYGSVGPETEVYADNMNEPTPATSRVSTILHMDWQQLQVDVPGCVACNLSQTRTQTVFGMGDSNAEWLIVGEAPGAEEDRKGEPFVGMAGKLLDNMLAAIQLQRGKNVYIANVLKCRPPENRDPHGVEVAECDPYLKRQVELIKPKLILALGKFAAQSLLNSTDTIAALRGKRHDYAGVPVIVTYHPAYLLRNLPDKAKAWEDLCFARATMLELQSGLQLSESPQS